MKSILLILALSLSITGLCGAQEATHPIRTEFVTLSVTSGVPAYYYRDKDRITKLEVSAHGTGTPVAYRGPAVLALYERPEDLAPRERDQPIPKPALHVTLPNGEDRILLIFSKTGTGPEAKILSRALGISTQKMKPGDYQVFNFSNTKAFILMNKVKVTVEPGKHSYLSSADWKSEIIDIEIKIGVNDDKGLRRVYSSVWGHMPVRRNFLFLFDRNDRYNPFQIRRHHDVPTASTEDSRE